MINPRRDWYGLGLLDIPILYTGSIVNIPASYNLVGYGTDSRFAYQLYDDTGNPSDLPVILYVDDLRAGEFNSDATHGTLAWALHQSVPRIILFETSGEIDFTDDAGRGGHSQCGIRSDYSETGYCWIVGQSAPSPGITIRGDQFEFRGVSDCLLQNIKIRVGADVGAGRAPEAKDAVNIYDCDNIVVDHCVISWSNDELIGSTANSTNITFSNNFIYEALACNRHYGSPDHTPELHPMCALVRSDGITFYRNMISFNWTRNPWLLPAATGSRAEFTLINNFCYNPSYNPGGTLGDTNYIMDVAVVGHVAYAPDPFTHPNSDYAVQIHSGIDHTSKIYVNDLLCKRKDDGNPDSGCVDDDEGIVLEGSTPIDLSAYSILPSDEVEDSLAANAGAKYKDAHDTRVLGLIEARTTRGDVDWGDNYLRTSLFANDITALPARVLQWDNTDGRIDTGFDWSSTPQQFDVNLNGGGLTTVTLTANTTDIDEVVDHINTRLTAAGFNTATEIECFKAYPYDHVVGLRTIPTGAAQTIIIDNSTATATSVNFLDGEYVGQDTLGSGWLVIPENTTTHTPPANPNDIATGYAVLTNAEVWILSTFGYSGWYVAPAPEAPPIATSVTISGTESVGSTLTGHYVYSDVNSDAEGVSTFRWLRSDDAIGTNKAAIAGATSITYTLAGGDEAKYITFEVTPVALTGDSPGDAVESDYTGAITSGQLFSDDFDSYADNTNLGDTADWVKVVGGADMRTDKPGADGQIHPNGFGAHGLTYYDTATDTNDQFSQLTYDSVAMSDTFVGVAVRIATGALTAYVYRSDSNNAELTEITAGTPARLGTLGTAWSPGDVVKITVEGTTISCYKNGVLDTTVATNGQFTDASIASGRVGLYCYDDGDDVLMDDWSGGDA